MDFYSDEAYLQIREDFSSLAENDFNEAFRLAKDSASAKSYYEDKYHEFTNLSEEAKYEITRVHSAISHRESPDNVSKGNRIADADPEVIALRAQQRKAAYVAGQLQTRVNFLGNVHFTTKSAYENANKSYRQGGN